MEDEIIEALKKNFGFLGDEVILAIAKESELYSVPEGHLIIDVDRYIKAIPLLIKGGIKVMRVDEEGREILLYYLKGGQTCATSFSCCMGHKKSNIKAEAIEDTTFVSVPLHFLEGWMSKYPTWRNFLMTAYEIRFNELLDTVDQLAFKKLDERLLDYLMSASEVGGSHVLKVSHQNIADDLNTSREVISRLLKKLELDGQLLVKRGQIELKK